MSDSSRVRVNSPRGAFLRSLSSSSSSTLQPVATTTRRRRNHSFDTSLPSRPATRTVGLPTDASSGSPASTTNPNTSQKTVEENCKTNRAMGNFMGCASVPPINPKHCLTILHNTFCVVVDFDSHWVVVASWAKGRLNESTKDVEVRRRR